MRMERRHSTRTQHRMNDYRPTKRLFTPEIKRYLKDWLIRRRDNPYPNRDEKKALAIQTGLTHVQVCNWFANWRRKLKNTSSQPKRTTWTHLIKTYNNQMHGEHFSICSDDSIWQERGAAIDHCYTNTNCRQTNVADKYEKPHIEDPPQMLTKWLQSAANFRPKRENYANWSGQVFNSTRRKRGSKNLLTHGREELDAAEALTKLACIKSEVS